MSTALKDVSAEQAGAEEKVKDSREPSLESSLKSLAKAGGFDFLEAIVDGADSMNPVRKAKRNIFLTDASKKDQRQELEKENAVVDRPALPAVDSVSEMVDKAVESAEISENFSKNNLKKILGEHP